AYFRNISKLRIRNLQRFGLVMSQVNHEQLAIELKNHQKATRYGRRDKLTEEEIARLIKRAKRRYQKSRNMRAAITAGFRDSIVIDLPGRISSATNLTRTSDSSVSLLLEGSKIVQAMNALTQDDTWWRKQVLAGRDIFQDGVELDPAFNKALLGEEAPIRAVIAGELKPAFDYKTELAAAKPAHQQMLQGLGVIETVVVDPADRLHSMDVRVGGVRMIHFSDAEREIRPLHLGPGYAVGIVADLHAPAIDITSGRIETALADNGESLLPD
ncbi:unnamed protein product, partial [marine sediment metagenome]